jgi:sRNA-binding protein
MPQDVNPLLDRLIEAFPACFSRSVPQPLKIDLDEELLAQAGVHPALADLTPDQIRQALQCYARRPAYRKALAKGGPRCDLDGQPAGEVTPEQQRDASRPRKTPPAPAPPAAPAVDLKARLQEVIALAIAGQMDEAIDGGFRPVKPAAPTFEPKAEPAAATPAPPGSPAMGDATPSLKRRT